jgi:uncharacterized membrane protein YdjX (TVP38/TMEM64 family)
LWIGSTVTLCGCVLGAIIAFVIGRYLARNWAKKKLQESPKLKALSYLIKKEGLSIIILSRLSPVFPFPILSYILGVTSISFWKYSLGTAIGLLPGVIAYCYMGI